MMTLANDEPTPKWRNFAAWSAVGAILYILVVWGAAALLQQDDTSPIFRSTKVTAQLALGLIFAMAVVGFTSRKRPLGLRTFRNFLIQNVVAVILFLLAFWGFTSFGGAMGASEGVAAVTGLVLVIVAFFGALATASVHMGADLIDDELAVDEMRERGRLILYSLVWMAACGLLLIGLSLSGPGGVLSPAAALAGALVLIAVLAVLGIAAWRLSDELGRTLSYEAGNMAFYLIWVVGSGWAVLAHLGFVAGPAPLDWLTMVTLLLFVASFIAVGRRKLITL